MPFTKEGDHYISPSGRKLTEKQVKMYYATHGTFNKSTAKKRLLSNRLK